MIPHVNAASRNQLSVKRDTMAQVKKAQQEAGAGIFQVRVEKPKKQKPRFASR